MVRSKRVKSSAAPIINGTAYTIHIGGKQFPVTVERVKVSTLKIDLKNPRLHSELGLKARNGEVTVKEVADAIWAQNDTKQLFQQILKDGGLMEPLFVRKNDVIAEGNRRRVCLDKILNDDEVAEQNEITDEMREHFEHIDIFRIPSEANEKDVLSMLLDWHVSAKKAWSKPDQTEILQRLHEGGMEVDELARRTRQSRTTIKNRLGAYDLLKKFRARNTGSGTTEQSHMLNHYRLVQANKVLREWINATDANFDLFSSFVKNGKIEEGKDTRDRLPKLVEDAKAMAALTDDDELKVKEAFEDFNKDKKRLFDIVSDCARAIRNASYREVVTFASNKPKQRKLRKLEAAIAAFMTNAKEAGQRVSSRASADEE